MHLPCACRWSTAFGRVTFSSTRSGNPPSGAGSAVAGMDPMGPFLVLRFRALGRNHFLAVPGDVLDGAGLAGGNAVGPRSFRRRGYAHPKAVPSFFAASPRRFLLGSGTAVSAP